MSSGNNVSTSGTSGTGVDGDIDNYGSNNNDKANALHLQGSKWVTQ